MLSALIFLPLGGVIALLVWRRATDTQVRTVALVTTLVTFAISLAVVATFDRSVPGFQHVQDASWVSSLNLRYIVGVDGISLWLVVMTAFLDRKSTRLNSSH